MFATSDSFVCREQEVRESGDPHGQKPAVLPAELRGSHITGTAGKGFSFKRVGNRFGRVKGSIPPGRTRKGFLPHAIAARVNTKEWTRV